MDTTKVTQEVQATFTQSQYGVTIPAHNQSGGSGIYYFDRSNRLVINFVDSGNHPVNYDRNNLLNGQYTIVTIDTNLVAIYKTSNNNQNFAGYLLKRTGS